MPHDIDKYEKDIICIAVALMNKDEHVRIPWNRLYKQDMGPQNATFISVLPQGWGADGLGCYFFMPVILPNCHLSVIVTAEAALIQRQFTKIPAIYKSFDATNIVQRL